LGEQSDSIFHLCDILASGSKSTLTCRLINAWLLSKMIHTFNHDNTLLISKVLAYITHANRLLVFSHPHSPEAGIQVPAGTLKDGERPEDAVLREAHEETGLTHLELAGFLGECQRDMSHPLTLKRASSSLGPGIWQKPGE